jgi:hypothetical protein
LKGSSARASFFTDSRGPGGSPQNSPAPSTRHHPRFRIRENPPGENSLANPNVAAAQAAATLGFTELFSAKGLSEFFIGVGASSKGHWGNFRRGSPRAPGINEEGSPGRDSQGGSTTLSHMWAYSLTLEDANPSGVYGRPNSCSMLACSTCSYHIKNCGTWSPWALPGGWLQTSPPLAYIMCKCIP